jgi:NAD(P)-dependent dehydrogenase (short-subunit alcohol dehydrogenase family)
VAAIYSIKHAAKKPFLDETHEAFTTALSEYVGGAMVFSQEAIKRFFADYGKTPLADGGAKKGTLIFTGTLGAIRTNTEYASYGASRASVRMLSQALGKEYSPLGIQVVHTIMNGAIKDEEGPEQEAGKWMSADAVGREYWHLIEQGPTLWTSELDMRPAQEKF